MLWKRINLKSKVITPHPSFHPTNSLCLALPAFEDSVFLKMWGSVCECVQLWEGEREREGRWGEGAKEDLLTPSHLLALAFLGISLILPVLYPQKVRDMNFSKIIKIILTHIKVKSFGPPGAPELSQIRFQSLYACLPGFLSCCLFKPKRGFAQVLFSSAF